MAATHTPSLQSPVPHGREAYSPTTSASCPMFSRFMPQTSHLLSTPILRSPSHWLHRVSVGQRRSLKERRDSSSSGKGTNSSGATALLLNERQPMCPQYQGWSQGFTPRPATSGATSEGEPESLEQEIEDMLNFSQFLDEVTCSILDPNSLQSFRTPTQIGVAHHRSSQSRAPSSKVRPVQEWTRSLHSSLVLDSSETVVRMQEVLSFPVVNMEMDIESTRKEKEPDIDNSRKEKEPETGGPAGDQRDTPQERVGGCSDAHSKLVHETSKSNQALNQEKDSNLQTDAPPCLGHQHGK